MRLKVQTLKTLLWFGNVLAFAAILGLLVHIFLHVKPDVSKKIPLTKKALETAMAVEPTIKPHERSAGINWSELKNLHQLNVTGVDPPAPVEANPEKEAGEVALPPIETKLKVGWIVASGDDPMAQIVPVTDQPGATPPPVPPMPAWDGKAKSPVRPMRGFYTVGDKLKDPFDKDPYNFDKPPYNAVVLDILDTGVKFQWGEQQVVLGPPTQGKGPPAEVQLDSTAPANTDTGEPVPVSVKPPPSAESRALNDNDWYIGTDDMARVNAEGKDLLNEVKISGIYVDADKRQRIVLKSVPEGTLAHQRGFRDNDILRKINGEDMSSTSGIESYFQSHAKLTSYNVEIERMGARIIKTFQVAR